ncbi:hypothetical protein QTP70_011643 [Hemibagrus guttatus]|uniref:Uncharacterized protein n=1 Tax=Hemibagrus guttatus TaxID=175788 RepID=A0AAE0QBX6_9TELE|nr:hypothetical protein QTP70_011643 [Hemibagrus guttatus]
MDAGKVEAVDPTCLLWMTGSNVAREAGTVHMFTYSSLYDDRNYRRTAKGNHIPDSGSEVMGRSPGSEVPLLLLFVSFVSSLSPPLPRVFLPFQDSNRGCEDQEKYQQLPSAETVESLLGLHDDGGDNHIPS